MKIGKNSPITNLKLLRQQLDISQEKLAAAIFCDIKTYRNYELGKTLPKTEILLNLRDFYASKGIDVTIDYLLGLSEYTSFFRENIGKITGLSDKAIKNLEYLNRLDVSKKEIADKDLIIPTLNKLLEFKRGQRFRAIFKNIRDFFHFDYKIPIYPTSKIIKRHLDPIGEFQDYEVKKSKSVAYDENTGCYYQYLANPNDLYDYISVKIDDETTEATQLLKLQMTLTKIKQELATK